MDFTLKIFQSLDALWMTLSLLIIPHSAVYFSLRMPFRARHGTKIKTTGSYFICFPFLRDCPKSRMFDLWSPILKTMMEIGYCGIKQGIFYVSLSQPSLQSDLLKPIVHDLWQSYKLYSRMDNSNIKAELPHHTQLFFFKTIPNSTKSHIRMDFQSNCRKCSRVS